MSLHSIMSMDNSALMWINSHHNPVLDAILKPISYAGEAGMVWILACVIMLIIGRPGYRRTAVILLITMIAVDRLIAAQLGHFYDRERPYLALQGIRQVGIRWASGSFPSGHAHSVWVATIILSSRWRKLWVPLGVFAVLTCYSRPYFGMHYPLDTLAGAVIGITVGSLVVWTDSRIQRREKRPAVPLKSDQSDG